MGYEWVTEWAGYELSYGTGSADSFHNDPNRSFTYSGNTPLTGYVTLGENKVLSIDANNFIQYNIPSSGNWSVILYYNGSSFGGSVHSGSGYNRTDILMMVDETNEKCAIYQICYRGSDGLSFIYAVTSGSSDESKAYLLYQLGNVPPIVYNWQSVPSISGKNGILQLSQIASASINNGEAVSGASASAFSNLENNSKVSVLASASVEDMSKVTVKYIVPEGTYEYIKLVYKKGAIPASASDGTVVNLVQADKSIEISGIADGSTYWFKIFTDISVSEPYEFTTVKPEPIMGNVFAPDFSTDGRDAIRYDSSKTVHIHHDDSGAVIDIDVTCGALFDLKHSSSPQYAISNNELVISNNSGCYFGWAYDVNGNQRVIPANCTLWFELDVYFTGSEGYVDWFMFDNQDRQVVYWCWDTLYDFHSGIWYNCKLEATVVNGYVTAYKYYVDDVMVGQRTASFHMVWVDEANPLPCKCVTFNATKPMKIKNMKIYSEVQ